MSYNQRAYFKTSVLYIIAFVLTFVSAGCGVCYAQAKVEVTERVTDSTLYASSNVNERLDGENDTLFQIKETVITARSRALLGFSNFGAVNLNTQKMNQIPSVLGVPDMLRMLQLLPGVQHSGEANGYLYVRGADPGHNLMLYNRVPVYGTSHLLGIFPFYNADHIARIRFDKSGSDAQSGNRLSATVEAISPDELPERFSIRGNVGLVVSQLTLSSPLGKRAGLVISGRQTYIDQIITPLLTATSDNEIDALGYSFSDGNFTLMLRPSAKHSIDINAFASGDRFKIADQRMLLNGLMKWNNHVGSISWGWQAGQNTKIKHEIYLSRYSNCVDVQQATIGLKVDSELFDWGVHSSAEFKLRSIPFATGVRYARYHVRPQEFSSSHLTNISETDNTVDAQYFSAYVQGKPQINEYLSLDLGLHVAHYSNEGNNRMNDLQLEPRVSLNYTGSDQWTAYLSYARKSQHLHLITTSSVGVPTDFWMATSEGVPIEKADNFAIGSDYKITSRIELSSGIFYSRMSNLVHYPFSVLQFNEITSFGEDLQIGKGKAYGAELMLKRTGRLSGWLSYTLSKSDRQFDEIDNGQPFLSKYDRRHNLSIALHYEISNRWSAGLTQVLTSGNRFTVPTSWYFINNNPVKEYGKYNNAQMPAYKRTDISVDYYLKKSNQRESVLNLSVYNLFAVQNPIYVILNARASDTGNQIKTWVHYKALYSILPSIGWRFVF